MKNLDDIRKVIDECDKDLVEIFEKRLGTVLDVLDYKKANNLPILQAGREDEVLKKVKSYLSNPEFEPQLESLYSHILKISRQLQSKKLFPFNIVLIGFMGSGKTSVGEELSKLLEMDFIDTDSLIIEKTGKTINEIFQNQGEDYFRQLETETIKNLRSRSNTIISCGGGVVLNPENIENLKENGKIIWLKAGPEEIYKRISSDKTRPLLEDDFGVEDLREKLELRLSLYEDSRDIEVDTDGKTVYEICQEIVEEIQKS